MADTAESPASESPASELPLAAWHRERGASFETRRGLRQPATYGVVEAEYAALREGCALVDRSPCDRLEILGEDRLRFLGGMCTRNVAAMEPGSAVTGFTTEGRGKIVADLTVLALPDRLWLELPPGRATAVGDHLRRYVVADRVEVVPLDEMLPLVVAGPEAGERLEANGVELPPEPGRHRSATVLGSGVQIERHRRLGVEGFSLWVSASLAPILASDLVDSLGVVPAGSRAAETLRVEAGLPAFGVDYGEENLPQETGLDDAVDFDKGCYLGQEVIARIHYRGQAPRRVRQLRFAAGPEPTLGDRLLYEGRECGILTSVAHSPRFGAVLGLAMLQRRAVEPGTGLTTASGTQAEVVEPERHDGGAPP